MTESVCPVCGQTLAGTDFICTDFYVSGEKFPVCKCSGCGFRMTGSAPDPGTIGEYYQSEDYVSHSNTRQGLVNRMYHLVRRFMLGQKYKMVVSHSGLRTGTLLDVGAGTGHFMKIMKEKKWETTGIEKSDQARHFASINHGLQLLPENGFWSLPFHSYDVITLWHVLEHLHEPEKYWSAFGRLIKPSGTLIIALPNPGSYDAGIYSEFWAAWDVPRHLWHFTPDNIIRMAEKHGFILRDIRRMPFDAFYVSILSEKYRKSAWPILKGMFVGMLSFGHSLFNKKKCSSLVYIFRS